MKAKLSLPLIRGLGCSFRGMHGDAVTPGTDINLVNTTGPPPLCRGSSDEMGSDPGIVWAWPADRNVAWLPLPFSFFFVFNYSTAGNSFKQNTLDIATHTANRHPNVYRRSSQCNSAYYCSLHSANHNRDNLNQPPTTVVAVASASLGLWRVETAR